MKPTATTSVTTPSVYLAGDIGTSASKFFYRVTDGQTAPLWMGSEVADGLTPAALPSLNAGGRPQDSAWLQLEDEVILVGDAAKGFLNHNSLAANKAEKAAYKIAAALGAIAELEQLPRCYEAVVWIPLPLTEIRTRDDIAAKLNQMGQTGFIFRGKSQRVQLSLKFFPEGFGLYLNRKKQLEQLNQEIEQRRTLILMMGHRNLSLLCFEGGSLKTAHSSSDGPGFWPAFEKTARSLGLTPADYPALFSALTTGQTQQISQTRAGLYDFAEAVAAVEQTYWNAVTIYWQDHLLEQLTEKAVNLVISGGAAAVMRPAIHSYFQELGLENTLSFADEGERSLPQLLSCLPEASSDTALSIRMADCYGLFQGLLGKLTPTAV